VFVQLHVQSYNQLQQMTEAFECGIVHLRELGVRLLDEMPIELRQWCYSLDPTDEESFERHPVLRMDPMTKPLHLISMQIMSAMVRKRNTVVNKSDGLGLRACDHSHRLLTPMTAAAAAASHLCLRCCHRKSLRTCGRRFLSFTSWYVAAHGVAALGVVIFDRR
jgi:hypothetical protein